MSFEDLKLPTAPQSATTFGLERLEGEQFDQIAAPELGGQWWELAAHNPHDVLEAIAYPGTYRIIWRQKDGRRKAAHSLPFTLTDDLWPNRDPSPDIGHELDHDTAHMDGSADPYYEQDAPPPAHDGQTSAPHTATPRRAAPQPPRIAAPRPPNRGRGARTSTALENLPDRAALHPLGVLTYLHGMAREDSETIHQQTILALQYTMEAERIRSADYAARLESQAQQNIENTRAHYAQLDKGRQDLMTMTLALITNKGPDPATVEVKRVLDQLTERLDDMADDAEEITENQLAQLSENPNDLERALASFQNTLGILANSPLGQALAQRLVGSLGGAPEPDMEAAE